MKIAFVVNDINTEKPDDATTEVALAATRMGHDVYYVGADDFAYAADETVAAHAVKASKRKESPEQYLSAVKAVSKRERIDLEAIDVVMLRNDPALDLLERPYRQSSGIAFGQLASARGTLVVNDPSGLSQALNKLYFHAFPDVVRPRTLVTRDTGEVRDFIKEQGGTAILKPLQGSGGESVFMVTKDDAPNLNQMIEAVCRRGYVVAQEYLPAAAKGDVRMFLMNGRPLESNGVYAAFARQPKGSDLRSNITAGGTEAKAKITDAMLHVAEMVRPKLQKDGMFLVGLDIAGDKLMEINVFTPGGLQRIKRLEGVDFAKKVIEALEQKVEYRRIYGRFANSELASM